MFAKDLLRINLNALFIFFAILPPVQAEQPANRWSTKVQEEFAITRFALSAVGDKVVVATGRPPVLWDLSKSERIGELIIPESAGCHDVLFLSDDNQLALTFTGRLVIYDIEKKEVVREISLDKSVSYRLGLSPDGSRLVVLGRDMLTIYESSSGKELTSHSNIRGSSQLWFPDSTRIAVGRIGEVQVINLESGEVATLRQAHPTTFYKPSISRNGRFMGVLAIPRDEVTESSVIDLLTGQTIRLATDVHSYTPPTFCPSSSLVAFKRGDTEIEVRGILTGEVFLRVESASSVASLTFTRDGKKLLWLNGSNALQLATLPKSDQ